MVGVELWEEVDGHPRWIASSNYYCRNHTEWASYVECCAKGAMEFVDRFEHEPNPLFNLSWAHQGELWKE